MNKEKLLIVVDMVNGFVKEGPMADPNIQHIIPACEREIKNHLADKQEVIFIRDCHKKGCREFLRYPEHCVEGTPESEVVDELKEYANNAIVFKKNSTSTMFADGFREFIDRCVNLKEVTIVGCCTDICVLNLAIPLQNYFDQKDRNVKIRIPKDAVETYNAPNHNADEYNDTAFKLLAQAGIELI